MDAQDSGITPCGAFLYRALDSPQDTTRLLTLLPGQLSDPVCVTIAHETCRRDYSVPYECLSYAWGSTEGHEDVHVRYESSNNSALLRCRSNLVTALRYLRHPEQSRVIWADAICIDQNNIDERSRLVAHMGEIYRRAVRTIVWLGEEDEGTAASMGTIEQLSTGILLPSHHRTCEILPGSEAEIVKRRPAESAIKSGDWQSLSQLMLKPWFKRLWVRQEVQLASKVLMKCGRLEIDWEKVEKVMIFLEQKVGRTYFKTHDIVRCRSLFPHDGSDRYANGPKNVEVMCEEHVSTDCVCSLMYALHRSSICECTDPRDRVYANLSTSTAAKVLDIVPNYALSVAEIYENLIVKYVQHFQDLNLLRLCDLDILPAGFKSFVPDFAAPKSQSRLLSVVYTHAGTRQPFSLRADGSVAVKGRRVDAIRSVSPAQKPLVEDNVTGGNYLDIITTFHQWEPDDLMTSSYPGGGSLLEAFVLLLTNGSIKETQNASHLPTLPESKASFLAAFSSSSDTQQIFSPRHEPYLKEVTSDRRPEIFFQTTQGYIGTSSSRVQGGDVVAVLLGASVPIVLRPSKEQQDAYQVVGPCYLQGVMFGEALFGPLPDGWAFFRDKYRKWCFKMQDTDHVVREDPRLWPLSEEWTTHFCSFDDEQNSCTESCRAARPDPMTASNEWFFNKATKERRTMDPRLDVQGLESGGVLLDHFVLV